MKIDAHQHFWHYRAEEYPWIQAHWPIRRSFLPVDLEPLLVAAGLEGSIAVQARQTLTETRWLLDLADRSPSIKGVVGWVDLRSEHVPAQLEEFTRHPKFLGVRHVVQDEPDPEFMSGAEFQRGIGLLQQFNLAYDILIYPRQLSAAIALAARFPEQRFVLDHLAKPLIKDRILDPWREQIRELARCPNVLCKVSGLVTEADPAWKPDDLSPYLEVVFEAFGEDRVMYGSDWPVCLLAGEYAKVFAVVDNYIRDFSSTVRGKFFGDNAARFYRVPP